MVRLQETQKYTTNLGTSTTKVTCSKINLKDKVSYSKKTQSKILYNREECLLKANSMDLE